MPKTIEGKLIAKGMKFGIVASDLTISSVED
jgi:hypothetical protein